MHKIFLPRLGQTMEEGRLTEWLVEPGEEFQEGEPLYEVETEKVTASVEANLPGRLVALFAEAGSTLKPGDLLAVAADPGEEPDDAAIERFLSEDGPPAATEEARREMEEAPKAASATSGPAGGGVRAMPRTRALARELSVDLQSVAGTGSGGQITEADVRAAAEGASFGGGPEPIADATPAEKTPAGPAIRERRPLSPVHRRMAEVVASSWAEVPQFTQTITVDAGNWKAKRDAWHERFAAPVTMTDLVLDGLVRAVAEVPEVNSRFDGDALVIYEDVNVSLAVDTPHGLQVPVLHKVQRLDVAARTELLREVAQRARDGNLGQDDVSGGTVTLSNLGASGVEGGVPLVTPPQVAIVFVGSVREQVVPVEGRMEVRPQCTLTNSFDHRALDGATAARFTAALRRHLEAPDE